MRIGIDGRKIPEARERGPLGTLDHARSLGLDGVFFRTVLDMTPTLDQGLLADVRAHADDIGLYLEAGLGKVNPYASPETPETRRIGDGDIVLGFRRMMEACAAIGCRELWVGTANYKDVYTGRLAFDRFRTDVEWTEQLAATTRFLEQLAPIARDLGIHLNLETHEEITSFELVRIIEKVGADVLGIVFDTGNVLHRVEHPVWAARRVAPYVRQTHIKDAALIHGDGGVCYQMRPCGTGVVPFDELLKVIAEANPTVNLTIENDEAREPGVDPLIMLIELYGPEFLRGHPDLTTEEFAAYHELLRSYEERVRSGAVPDLAEYAARPFGYAETVAYIKDSADHLRKVCATHGLPLETSVAQNSEVHA
ncbi:sugar phosphate isomerase/epimerase family protein [Streptomyces sp. NPDC046821]|uniref:sugar phosphate isomerase/epimerase family protein n=1 Tax=Streptomyces sp. NPDC046821 TaxID=3154702 RepID=UPI003410BC10